MRPFYCYHPEGTDPETSLIQLSFAESHHLLMVLRARLNDKVVVFNGSGQQWEGVLKSNQGKIATIEVNNSYQLPERKPRLILAQCMTKFTTFETIIRKATELGVASIIPIISLHTEAKTIVNQWSQKKDRLATLCVEACKQSNHLYVPVIEAPVLFADFLKSDVLKFNPLKLVASLRGRNPYLLELLQTEKKSYESIICLIGPEGDLSEAEHQGALKGAFMPVRLSANVLRSDTAALYLLTLLDQWIIA